MPPARRSARIPTAVAEQAAAAAEQAAAAVEQAGAYAEQAGAAAEQAGATPSRPARTPSRPARTPSRPARTPSRPARPPSRPARTPSRPARPPTRPARTPSRCKRTPHGSARSPIRRPAAHGEHDFPDLADRGVRDPDNILVCGDAHYIHQLGADVSAAVTKLGEDFLEGKFAPDDGSDAGDALPLCQRPPEPATR